MATVCVLSVRAVESGPLKRMGTLENRTVRSAARSSTNGAGSTGSRKHPLVG
jgi:hypothetical protein